MVAMTVGMLCLGGKVFFLVVEEAYTGEGRLVSTLLWFSFSLL